MSDPMKKIKQNKTKKHAAREIKRPPEDLAKLMRGAVLVSACGCCYVFRLPSDLYCHVILHLRFLLSSPLAFLYVFFFFCLRFAFSRWFKLATPIPNI